MSARDEISDDAPASDGARTNPFRKRTDYDPDDFVAIKVRFKSREEFNLWYESQYPGVNMLPARDGWADDVFALGLEEMKRLMPAQLSPAERFAQARAAKG